ncbi:CYTH domain-containing protein [Candidatus Pacearchaeota archaeon]|nr:CYTH domain-containing protein [Candidatus Pacearchaeota archaeon]
MNKNIEVEIRSLISQDKYDELISFFKQNSEFLGEDYQETHYFDSDQDLRIQKNNTFSKVWLKKGKIHDDHREEIEIKCKKEDFEKLESLYHALGYKVSIKWFRNRHSFDWNGIVVALDHTKGYGHIIELEILSDEENKEKNLKLLKEKLASLNIPLTPKEQFDVHFKNYKENWQELTQG